MKQEYRTWDGLPVKASRRHRIYVGVVKKLPVPLAATLGAIFIVVPLGKILLRDNPGESSLLVAILLVSGAMLGAMFASFGLVVIRTLLQKKRNREIG